MFLKLLFSIIISHFTSSLFVLYYCYILNISFMAFIGTQSSFNVYLFTFLLVFSTINLIIL